MGLCVHWGLRGISTSSGSSALSARRALRARRSDFSAQRKKKMIACVASDPVSVAAMACATPRPRREDRQVDGGGEPVLFIRIRRVLVDDEPLVRALGHVGPEADVVQDGAAVDVGDVATCADATRPSRHRRDSAR